MKKTKKYSELNALKGKIREEKSNYRKLARDIGIGITSFVHKINGISSFDAPEICKLANELNISSEDFVKYFFPDVLRNVTI